MLTKGVIDRIEEGEYAVLLFEDIGKEFMIPLNRLPEGSGAGMWVDAKIEGEELHHLSLAADTTVQMQGEMEAKINRLKQRSGGSRFKRR